MTRAKKCDKDVLRAFMERPIAYYPAFARLAGGVTAGVFLSQLFYWTGKGKSAGGWIWKSQQDWEDETCLSRREQETARRKLRALGVIEERRAGVPATLHYRIVIDRLYELLAEQSSMAESANLDWRKAPNWIGGKRQSNPETTPENTHIGTASDAPLEPPSGESSEDSVGGSLSLAPTDAEGLRPGKDPPREKARARSDERSAKRDKGVPAAVRAYRSAAHRYPPKSWYEEIAVTVGTEPKDLSRWKRLVHEWVGRGWNPGNVAGMLEVWNRGGVLTKAPSAPEPGAQMQQW